FSSIRRLLSFLFTVSLSLSPSSTPSLSTLSLHDALPIFHVSYYDQFHGNLMYGTLEVVDGSLEVATAPFIIDGEENDESTGDVGDRKSTRLNSSHVSISYAVFCLKKKKNHF